MDRSLLRHGLAVLGLMAWRVAAFTPGSVCWNQVAAALRNPRSGTGQVILGTANYLTAAICALTGDQPAAACTPAVRSRLGRENSGSLNQGAVSVWPAGAAAP